MPALSSAPVSRGYARLPLLPKSYVRCPSRSLKVTDIDSEQTCDERSLLLGVCAKACVNTFLSLATNFCRFCASEQAACPGGIDCSTGRGSCVRTAQVRLIPSSLDSHSHDDSRRAANARRAAPVSTRYAL